MDCQFLQKKQERIKPKTAKERSPTGKAITIRTSPIKIERASVGVALIALIT